MMQFIEIITCPHCRNYYKNQALMSWNTFGAQYWSDGKRIASGLPDLPWLVFCKKCDQPFKVRDTKVIASWALFDDEPPKWQNTDYLQFPSFHQYFKALELIPEEKHIRVDIWRTFNDYIRNNTKNEITPEMQRLNTENCLALLKILDENNKTELLMKAELLRNLRRFEESKAVLFKVNAPELVGVKEKLLLENDKKNSDVVKFN